MFDILPTLYPRDFVDFIIRNYFRFLDDIVYKWLDQFDITQFYQIFECLDPNLKFLFSNQAKETNFLDITFKVENDSLIIDVYHKPTDSFNFLNYSSCHPFHTKNNISLSLAKRIVNIVSNDFGPRLNELKDRLIQRDHPVEVINFSFSKVYQPKNHRENSDIIVFSTTFNPRHKYDQNIISNLFNNITGYNMKKALTNVGSLRELANPRLYVIF